MKYCIRLFCIFSLYFQHSNTYLHIFRDIKPLRWKNLILRTVSFMQRRRKNRERILCTRNCVCEQFRTILLRALLSRTYLLRFPYLRGAEICIVGCIRCVFEQVQYPINSETFTSQQWPLRRLGFAAAISLCRVVIGRLLFADCNTYEFCFDFFPESNFYYCYCQ